MRFILPVTILGVLFLTPGCGGPSGGADDAGTIDAARADTGVVGDAGTTSDGGLADGEMCADCAAPPPGCTFTDPCHCAGLVCEDAGESIDAGAATDGGMSTDAASNSDVGALPDGGAIACTPRCGRAEYCAYASGTCGAAGGGSCMARPEICTDLYAPVCGCDGVTYSNDCAAAAAGQNVASDGECPVAADCRMTSCPRGESCQACRGVGGVVYVCIPGGAVC